MARYQKATFKRPVLKDQTVNANYGLVVEIGDTVVIAMRDDRGTQPVSVTLTNVENDGKTLEWDSGTSHWTTDHTERVHKKHQKRCPSIEDVYVLASQAAGPIEGITIEGVYYEFDTAITVTEPHASDLEDEINAILNGNGTVTVTFIDAATDKFEIEITGTTLNIHSIVSNGSEILFEYD